MVPQKAIIVIVFFLKVRYSINKLDSIHLVLCTESAEDLARQQKIKYGAVEGGSTAAFFRVS